MDYILIEYIEAYSSETGKAAFDAAYEKSKNGTGSKFTKAAEFDDTVPLSQDEIDGHEKALAIAEKATWDAIKKTAKQCYQEINNGNLVRYCDVDTGETIELPELHEARVIDAKPPKPQWAE